MLDPRTPVLVGAAQYTQRVDSYESAEEPLALMARVLEAAAEDAEAPALLSRADSIRVSQGIWKYANPAAWLAERFGVSRCETVLGSISGTNVQSMLNDAATEVQEGHREVVLLVGAETEHSVRRARRAGGSFRMTEQTGPPVDREIGKRTQMRGNPDFEAGLSNAISFFALFEVALRHHLGEDPPTYQRRLGELWARFAEVASRNEHAWVRDAPSAEAIATSSDANRQIAVPYTKWMVANMVVDQAAALILTSVENAQRLSIPRDRWIFPLAGTDAVVVRYVSERVELYDEPPIALAGRRALELVGLEPNDANFVDLYSCFPVAVQLASRALGLDPGRPLTVTGGLSFAGGPLNSYGMHAIATMMAALRASPGSTGLVSAIGGSFSKHAFGVLGSGEPTGPYRFEDLADEVAALPARAFAAEYTGDARIESYSVTCTAGAPDRAVIACRTPDDARCWARTEDPDLLAQLAERDEVGRAVTLRNDRSLAV